MVMGAFWIGIPYPKISGIIISFVLGISALISSKILARSSDRGMSALGISFMGSVMISLGITIDSSKILSNSLGIWMGGSE